MTDKTDPIQTMENNGPKPPAADFNDPLIPKGEPKEEPKPEPKKEPAQHSKPEEKIESNQDPYGLNEHENDSSQDSESDSETDEYGNELPKQSTKTYTEDEVNARINEAVRERLSRLERSQQTQTNQQAAEQHTRDNFAYDPNDSDSWQAQLDKFVRNTVVKLQTEEFQKHQQAVERAAQAQFEQKFLKGMERFSDFKDVVSKHPITDAMLKATADMQDPSAFIRAACIKAPKDLERISKISDPFAQAAAIGQLESKLRVQKKSTNAPRPAAKHKGDASAAKDDRPVSIEELMRRSEQKRLDRFRR